MPSQQSVNRGRARSELRPRRHEVGLQLQEGNPSCSSWGRSRGRVPGTAQRGAGWASGTGSGGCCSPGAVTHHRSPAPVQDEHSCPWMANPELRISRLLLDSCGGFFLFFCLLPAQPLRLPTTTLPCPGQKGLKTRRLWRSQAHRQSQQGRVC